MFTLCVCRASVSKFIIPYWKFFKSFDHSFYVGMGFKMRLETEDTAERRFGTSHLFASLDKLPMDQNAYNAIDVLFSGTLG